MTPDLIPLPIVSCDGCGACCETIGTPPGFYAAYCSPQWDGVFLADADDYQYWLAMPETLRQELRTYYEASRRGKIPDREQAEMPCLWYDVTAKRCGHYDHRPSVCREFEVGEEDCLRMREECGL